MPARGSTTRRPSLDGRAPTNRSRLRTPYRCGSSGRKRHVPSIAFELREAEAAVAAASRQIRAPRVGPVVGRFSRQIDAARIAASYFIGTLGVSSVGGQVMVHAGKGALLMLIPSCGLAALSLAILHDRPVPLRTQ
ncbi:hypothetical protein [Burkholderia latens]